MENQILFIAGKKLCCDEFLLTAKIILLPLLLMFLNFMSKMLWIAYNIAKHMYSNTLYICFFWWYDGYKKGSDIMAQISLRIDDEVKKNAEQACEDIGMSMSTAITIYLKKLGRERRIPFEVSADPFYSDENITRLRKSVAQMESTGGTIHEVNLDD